MNEDPTSFRIHIPAMDANGYVAPRAIFVFKDPVDEVREHRELWLKLQRLEALYPWLRRPATKLRLPTKEGTCA